MSGPGEDKKLTPAIPQSDRVYSEDGVDLTLIRWMLSLTPAERLDVLQQHLRSILRLRGEENDL